LGHASTIGVIDMDFDRVHWDPDLVFDQAFALEQTTTRRVFHIPSDTVVVADLTPGRKTLRIGVNAKP
jgi:hypothetical protein